MRSVKHIQDVVDWGLCVGCGACYSVCEKQAVTLVNMEHIGIRPKFKEEACKECTDCLTGCPGYRIDARIEKKNISNNQVDHNPLIGPTLEVWEGYAADQEIRHSASSGGLLTALSLYCLEKEGMELVLHTGMHPEKPWMNKTVHSKTREELLSHTGSRYNASSPCDSLKLIEESKGPCVFIGKPCDTAAVQAFRKQRPDLDAKVGLVLTFCCAGVPSMKATLDLLRKLRIDTEKINGLSYRGNGWPGGFTTVDNVGNHNQHLPYMESWRFLQKYRCFRCQICPDGLGELCDISCGDAWHRYDSDPDNPGVSLVMVRSDRGKEILHKAMGAGYLMLEPSSPENAIKAQELVERRKEIFGRQLAMRLLWIPTTKFIGFRLFHCWLKAHRLVKIKSVLGTMRRLIQRGFWHRNPI